jgi:hypothetical protein
MTTEERLERLELAICALARTIAANFPIRGNAAGIEAAQQIDAEVRAIEDGIAVERRREALKSELAELEGVA